MNESDIIGGLKGYAQGLLAQRFELVVPAVWATPVTMGPISTAQFLRSRDALTKGDYVTAAAIFIAHRAIGPDGKSLFKAPSLVEKEIHRVMSPPVAQQIVLETMRQDDAFQAGLGELSSTPA